MTMPDLTLELAVTALLVIGANLRLSRLVLTDDLGQMWVQEPVARVQNRLRQRAVQAEHVARSEHTTVSRHFERIARRDHLAVRYLEGFSCPFCVGFWIGVVVSALTVLAWHLPEPVLLGWEFVLAVLTLNWVVAHVGVRVGDNGYDDE